MPDPAGTLIVVNSFVLAEIAKVVSGEQSGDIGEAEPAADLLKVISGTHHAIVVTKTLVRREYESAPRRYSLQLLQPALTELGKKGIVKEARTRAVRQIPSIPQTHRAFFQEALRTGCRYLLTRKPEWLGLHNILENDYGLLVVTPEEYVRRQIS